jgi:DNA-binding GntR family transcriptional regulator
VVWGRLRDKIDRPPKDHHSFTEHEALIRAIEERDLDGASQAMARHLSHVQANLLAPQAAAE